MFSRRRQESKPEATSATESPAAETREGAKNRPTPSRKEAEAARKRPLIPADRKAAESASKEKVREERERTRRAMMAGEEWALVERDRGKQRKFIRDYIDARWNIGEFLLPAILIGMALSLTNHPQLTWAGLILDYVAIVATVLDLVLLNVKLRKLIRAKFHEDPRKGTGFYIFTRAVQIRPGRIPKPAVKRGQFPH